MSFQRDSTNFLVLKKIPGMFVLRRFTRQISKLDRKGKDLYMLHALDACGKQYIYQILHFWKQPKKGVSKN